MMGSWGLDTWHFILGVISVVALVLSVVAELRRLFQKKCRIVTLNGLIMHEGINSDYIIIEDVPVFDIHLKTTDLIQMFEWRGEQFMWKPAPTEEFLRRWEEAGGRRSLSKFNTPMGTDECYLDPIPMRRK